MISAVPVAGLPDLYDPESLKELFERWHATLPAELRARYDAARATQLRDVTRMVPQGFVIPAVLETAIDSDFASARTSVTPKPGDNAAPAYVPCSARKASSSGAAAVKLIELTAAVASCCAFLVLAEVGPLCCIVNAQRTATSASEQTIEIRPKARPIAQISG